MTLVNKYEVLRRAFDAAHHINALATNLKAQAVGAIPFTTVQGHLDSMREAYDNRIAPMLALGSAAAINPQISTFFVGLGTPLPANTYAQFQLVGTELTDLFVAYDPVFDTLTPINFDPSTGHSDASIPVAQLATLADELDAVIAAVAPLV